MPAGDQTEGFVGRSKRYSDIFKIPIFLTDEDNIER